ncbi:hypothetical protein ABWH93_17935 [Seohaeicola saemankumensis]|uniref:hypothetical protein n=1 Tax=Seohaeicola TaxID=481178 RepID=UPI0035D089BF
MSDTSIDTRAPLGWSGFAAGAAALVLTLVLFWAGPFAPQQSAGVSIGELAAEIAKSAARSVAGQPQPGPAAIPRTIDDHLAVAVGVLAGFAVVLGVASLIRHEHKRAALSGIGLGAAAIGIQLFAYAIMMIVGALVIASTIYAMRDTLGDILGG